MSPSTRRRAGRTARTCLALIMGVAVAVGAGASASADTIDDGGFESFAIGDPVGQFGWTAHDVGGYYAAAFDVAIADPSSVWTGGELGTRALRLSNATTSLAFGNQLQTPSLADEVGESGASNNGLSGGVRQSRLSGSFDFASATKTYQPGLAITFSPDRGDGARMSFFRITDQPAGLQVSVVYVESSAPYNFVETVVATGLPRDAVQHFEFTLDVVDGPGNDVLWTSIGGQCASFAQSGSWEDYHRNTTEGAPPHDTKTVDSLLIRISTTGNEALRGLGLFLDNVTLTSSTVPAMPPLGTPAAPAGTTASVNFTSVAVTGTTVATNACAPVTTYTVSAWPLGGGAPAVFSSTTPSFTFPTPFEGAFTLTMNATNSQGTSAEGPVSLAFGPVFAGEEDALAATGTDAGVLLAAGTLTIVLGATALNLRGRRRTEQLPRPSRP